MSTAATAVLHTIADGWEDQYASGVNSGIVGDLAHRLRGGPHISIEDQPSDNYSVVRPDDKAPPGKWDRDKSAAIDQSMNTADMVRCYGRVHAVWADHSDPRRKFFNAFNVYDGSGDAVRLDFVANTATYATDDHKWHVHGELRRRYVNDPQAGRAWLSMTAGQSKADWIKQEEAPMADPNVFKANGDGIALIYRVLALLSGEDAKFTIAGVKHVEKNAIAAAFVEVMAALSALAADVAEIKAAPPAGTVTISPEELDASLRRVLGSLDGASPPTT